MTKYMVDFQQWLFIYWIQPLNEPLFCFNIFFRLFVWQNRKQNKSDVLLGERPVWAAQPAISPRFSSGIAMLEYCRVKTLETLGNLGTDFFRHFRIQLVGTCIHCRWCHPTLCKLMDCPQHISLWVASGWWMPEINSVGNHSKQFWRPNSTSLPSGSLREFKII